jgi:3-hydroxybutyryl-CoA dehydratase
MTKQSFSKDMLMSVTHAKIGDSVRFSKTVSESDVYMFAGITGDLSQNHVDNEFMRHSIYGQRVAHGALLIGFMSTASTRLIEQSLQKGVDSTPVSLGYDGVRFLKPVFFDDTIAVIYTIDGVDLERHRTTAKVEVVNQRGELVAVAQHILKWTSNADSTTRT